MRTTIRLDDDLLREAKVYAAATDRTLSRLIEDALREASPAVTRSRSAGACGCPPLAARARGQASIWTATPDFSTSWKGWNDLPDVNVLIHVHRRDAREHPAYRDWLENILNGDATYAVSDVVLSGFVRVATHPKIMELPARSIRH